MSLPKIENEFSYIKIDVPSGRRIGVRPWKVKDEKELLFTLDSDGGEEAEKIQHIKNFLKGCSDNPAIFTQFSEADLNSFAVECRQLSKGDTIDFSYTCPGTVSGCGMIVKDRVSLSECTTRKNFDATPVVVNSRITLTFCDLPHDIQIQLEEKYKGENIKYAFYYMLSAVDSITIDGNTHTEFTVAELEENIIDELSSDELSRLTESFESKASEVKIVKKSTCIKCKKQTDIRFEDLLSFLVL